MIGGMVCGGFFLLVLGWAGYAILTYHQRDPDQRTGCGIYLLGLVTLVVAGQMFAFFWMIPRVMQVNALGLSLAEIHQATHISFTTARFWDLKKSLPEMREKIAEPDAPIWAHVTAQLRERLGPPTRFGRDTWATFLAWASSLVPDGPVTTERAIVAAVERLTGEDNLPARIRRYGEEIEHVHYQPGITIQRYVENYLGGTMGMTLFYPNDDMALLFFGGGVGGAWATWGEVTPGTPVSPEEAVARTVLWVLFALEGMLVLAFAIQRCFRWLTLSLVGRLLLLGGDRRFQTFEREVYSPGRYLVTLGMFAVLILPLNVLTMEPYVVLIHPGYVSFFLACLWNLLFCGILVEGLEHLVGVFFLRVGIDPLRTIWDNVLASLLAIGILLVFQNSWPSIVLGLGIGMAQSLIAKVALPEKH